VAVRNRGILSAYASGFLRSEFLAETVGGHAQKKGVVEDSLTPGPEGRVITSRRRSAKERTARCRAVP